MSAPDVTALSGVFGVLLQSAITTGASLHGMMLPFALPLLGALTAVVLVWTLFKHFLGDGFVESIVSAVQTVFTAAFISVLLSVWVAPIPGLNVTVSRFFIDGFGEFAMHAQGGKSHDEVTTTLLKAAMGMGTTVPPVCTDEIVTSSESGSFGQTYTVSSCSVVNGDNPGLWSRMATMDIGDFLFAIVFRLIASLVLLCALLYYQILLIMVVFIGDLGICLGPLMLPWLIWRPTAWLFDGWLKYMVAAGMYGVVAAITILFSMNMLNNLNTVSTTSLVAAGLGSGTQTPLAFMAIIIAGISLYLMRQVQGITDKLLGGGSIDLSPRLARIASGAVRMASGVAGAASHKTSATTGGATGGGSTPSKPTPSRMSRALDRATGRPPSAPSPSGARLGGGGFRRVGTSSAAAKQRRIQSKTGFNL